jgi:hypothetical protein
MNTLNHTSKQQPQEILFNNQFKLIFFFAHSILNYPYNHVAKYSIFLINLS